jgi:hypothetical protein
MITKKRDHEMRASHQGRNGIGIRNRRIRDQRRHPDGKPLAGFGA